jgi:peptide chain release factor 2
VYSHLGGIFDYASKRERLTEVELELQAPAIWDTPKIAQELGKEKVSLERIVNSIDALESQLQDAEELLELVKEERDEHTAQAVKMDLSRVEKLVESLEFQRMFSGNTDHCNAFLDIQAGSGGTEAQDWAEMLLRMYLKWGESHQFIAELIEVSPGDVAGIKSVTVKFSGDYAFGWSRTETGVHRLVRKSPFDSGSRRHTSFASVFVAPEIEDDIVIDINPSDIRVDTYRASGAGGQHINKTDSAVRLTHKPTSIVVQCQNERSQHKNRDQAMKLLRSKMYEQEMLKREADQQLLEDSKANISWGSQIRSYVLDQSRIKDLRTNVETGNTQAVLDGGLDIFIKSSLRNGL